MDALIQAETEATNRWIAAIGTDGEAAALEALRAAQAACTAAEIAETEAFAANIERQFEAARAE